MENILNLNVGQTTDLANELNNEINKEIHVRIKKRNGRKYWTFIEGLDKLNEKNINLNNILKQLRNKVSCGGSLLTDKESRIKVIQLQGDHRLVVRDYLIDNNIVGMENIKLHG